MAQCPSCSQPINTDDFGLVTCEGCGASVMVDFDGSISADAPVTTGTNLTTPEQEDASKNYQDYGGSPDNSEFEGAEMPEGMDMSTMVIDRDSESETSVLQTPHAEELDEKEMADWDGDENSSKVVTIGHKTMDYEKYVEEGGEIPGEQESVPEGSVPAPPSFMEEDPFEAPVQQVAEPEEPPFKDERTQVIESHQVRQSQGDFVDETQHPYDGDYESVNEGGAAAEASLGDIERYGNSNSANEGPLLYSITISGIDSQELREQVKEALTDRRLLFDVEGLMRGIKDGQIRLQEVSSLKTHVLVNQLLSLPLKFEWGQEANGNP